MFACQRPDLWLQNLLMEIKSKSIIKNVSRQKKFSWETSSAFKKTMLFFPYKILALTNKRLGAKLINDYILDVTPQEEIEKHKTYLLAQRNYRKWEHGKPSKRPQGY